MSATSRLEARISSEVYSMVKRAAEVQGRTITDFVTTAVQAAAQQAIEDSEVVRLSMANQKCFAEALLLPAKPNAALKKALAHRKTLLRDK